MCVCFVRWIMKRNDWLFVSFKKANNQSFYMHKNTHTHAYSRFFLLFFSYIHKWYLNIRRIKKTTTKKFLLSSLCCYYIYVVVVAYFLHDLISLSISFNYLLLDSITREQQQQQQELLAILFDLFFFFFIYFS